MTIDLIEDKRLVVDVISRDRNYRKLYELRHNSSPIPIRLNLYLRTFLESPRRLLCLSPTLRPSLPTPPTLSFPFSSPQSPPTSRVFFLSPFLRLDYLLKVSTSYESEDVENGLLHIYKNFAVELPHRIIIRQTSCAQSQIGKTTGQGVPRDETPGTEDRSRVDHGPSVRGSSTSGSTPHPIMVCFPTSSTLSCSLSKERLTLLVEFFLGKYLFTKRTI